MHQKRKLIAMIVLLCGAASCADAADDAEPSPYTLERDFGGSEGLLGFFATTDDDEIREVLASYGIGFVTHTRDQNVRELPPSPEHDAWHAIDGQYLYVDAEGRTTNVLGRSTLGRDRDVSYGGLPLCVANRCPK